MMLAEGRLSILTRTTSKLIYDRNGEGNNENSTNKIISALLYGAHTYTNTQQTRIHMQTHNHPSDNMKKQFPEEKKRFCFNS